MKELLEVQVHLDTLKEKVENVVKSIKELEDLRYIPDDIKDAKEELKEVGNRLDEIEEKYLSKTEFHDKFDLVRTLVFGAAGLMLVSILSGIIAIVVKISGQ